ncbi:MAG TPA: hypothetical protein VH044_02300 [Polyangiaceae bacterium]|nr:hypothetical protein [Polyangiaceae bacterium]
MATSIGAILGEAFRLYRRHLVTLLVTCAIVLVPVSLAKSAAMALIVAPSTLGAAAGHVQSLTERTASDVQRTLDETDPTKRPALEDRQQKDIEDLQRELTGAGTDVAGGLVAVLLSVLAALVGISLMYALAVPLATGALTVIVADLIAGESSGPAKGYARLLARSGKLFTAGTLAFLAVAAGLVCLVVPGLILAFLFSFVVPVVLIENVGGMAALKRSVKLVNANVFQVAVVLFVFAGIRLVASIVTTLLVPSAAVFLDSLVQDSILMLTLPIPILGTVLLYFDLRRQADGLDAQGIRSALAT